MGVLYADLIASGGGEPNLDEIAAVAGVAVDQLRVYFTSTAAIERALIAPLDPDAFVGSPPSSTGGTTRW